MNQRVPNFLIQQRRPSFNIEFTMNWPYVMDASIHLIHFPYLPKTQDEFIHFLFL